MSKHYYLGRTLAGAIVARSGNHKYAFAAVIEPGRYGPGQLVPSSEAKFSGSLKGALQNLRFCASGPYETVPVEPVDADTFEAATSTQH